MKINLALLELLLIDRKPHSEAVYCGHTKNKKVK
jgi:hypothetical protein